MKLDTVWRNPILENYKNLDISLTTLFNKKIELERLIVERKRYLENNTPNLPPITRKTNNWSKKAIPIMDEWVLNKRKSL